MYSQPAKHPNRINNIIITTYASKNHAIKPCYYGLIYCITAHRFLMASIITTLNTLLFYGQTHDVPYSTILNGVLYVAVNKMVRQCKF